MAHVRQGHRKKVGTVRGAAQVWADHAKFHTLKVDPDTHYLSTSGEGVVPCEKPAALIVDTMRSRILSKRLDQWIGETTPGTGNHTMPIDIDLQFYIGYKGVEPIDPWEEGYRPVIAEQDAKLAGLCPLHASLFYVEKKGWYIRALEHNVYVEGCDGLVCIPRGDTVILRSGFNVFLGRESPPMCLEDRIYRTRAGETKGICFRIYWTRPTN